GSVEKYFRVSCIHPMFHLRVKPSPPSDTGAVTLGQAVDSSAMTCTPGCRARTDPLSSRRKEMASSFSRPPPPRREYQLNHGAAPTTAKPVPGFLLIQEVPFPPEKVAPLFRPKLKT